MSRIRIVLAIESLLLRETLTRELESCRDMQVVAAPGSPFELLRAFAQHEADVVVIETRHDDGMPGILTHLFDEFPRALAVAVDRQRDRAVVYRQEILADVCEGASVMDLVRAMRTAESEYWSHAES